MPTAAVDNFDALLGVLREVAATGYRFIVPTPLTHQRILARRAGQVGASLPDVFGWNLPFAPTLLPSTLRDALLRADMLQPCGDLLRSRLRIASIGEDLFLHSAFPTNQEDAVFFGPDTYRFGRFIRQALAPLDAPPHPVRILDIGCGSGAGGITAVRALTPDFLPVPDHIDMVMNDINPFALRLTGVNAAAARTPVTIAEGDALSAVDGQFDLIISNPPYMDDGAQRAYRHGGAGLGRALSVRITAESLPRLARGGRLLLYTGVAIIDGRDPFLEELQPLLEASDCDWNYAEIDPDIFGEELAQPQYAHADRIAAVGLVARRKRAH